MADAAQTGRDPMQPVTPRPVSPPLRWRGDLEDGWQSLRRVLGLRLLLSSEPLLQLVIHLGRLIRGRVRIRVWARVWRGSGPGSRLGVDLDFRSGFASKHTFASSMFIGLGGRPGRPGLGGRGGADAPAGRGGRGGADGPPGRAGGFSGSGGAPPGAPWLGLGLGLWLWLWLGLEVGVR